MTRLLQVGLLAALVLASSWAGPARAHDAGPRAQTPESLPGAVTIGVDGARALLGKARFVDGRLRASYLEGHVRGALSSPHPGDGTTRSGPTAPLSNGHPAPAHAAHPAPSPHGHLAPAHAARPAPDAFGPDKEAPIVVYGHGPDCWLGADTARDAVARGYRQVYWMREGWDGWSAKQLPSD